MRSEKTAVGGGSQLVEYLGLLVRNLRIGIDAALWFFHAKAAGYGENFELQLFFHRCCRLLSMPVDVLFVFDGPGKPQFKRGQQVKTDENVLTDGVRALAEAFGFDTIVAPGEAEAALAQLNSRLGIIDAMLTNDVDALIFGATTILRDSRLNTGQRYADILDIYTSRFQFHNVEGADGVQEKLTERLILISEI